MGSPSTLDSTYCVMCIDPLEFPENSELDVFVCLVNSTTDVILRLVGEDYSVILVLCKNTLLLLNGVPFIKKAISYAKPV